jgi:hypothetical protein
MKNLRTMALGLNIVFAGACADVEEPGDVVVDESTESLAQVAGPRASAAAFGCPGTRIALRASNGDFASAVVGGGSGMVANRKQASDWETFTVYDLGQNRVALQTNNGTFVVAVNGGGGSLLANARAINEDAAFTVLRHWDGSAITLQTFDGYFVTAEYGGGSVMNAMRRAVGQWEAFTVVCRSIDLQPPPVGTQGPQPGTSPGGGAWTGGGAPPTGGGAWTGGGVPPTGGGAPWSGANVL